MSQPTDPTRADEVDRDPAAEPDLAVAREVVLHDVRDEPLSIDEVLALVRHPRCGGIAVFVGVVRDHDHGEAVSSLDYSAHPSVVDTLGEVCREVVARHDVARMARGAPCRSPRGRRPRRGGRGVGGASGRCLRRLPRPGRHAQGPRPDLEAPAVQRRRRRVGGPSVSQDLQQPSAVTIDPQTLSRRAVLALVLGFLVIVLGALSVMVGLPYVVMQPGPVTNTLGTLSGNQLITVSGAPTYPTQGALDFTTVRVVGGPGVRVTVWDLLAAKLNPSDDIQPEDALFPTGRHRQAGPGAEHRARWSTPSRRPSPSRSGPPAARCPSTSSSPRSRRTRRPRRCCGRATWSRPIDGTPVTTSDADPRRDLTPQARRLRPAAAAAARHAEISVAAKTHSSAGRTTIGVFLGLRFTFPVDVKINAGDVGGPSAGTMFALGRLRQAHARCPDRWPEHRRHRHDRRHRSGGTDRRHPPEARGCPGRRRAVVPRAVRGLQRGRGSCPRRPAGGQDRDLRPGALVRRGDRGRPWSPRCPPAPADAYAAHAAYGPWLYPWRVAFRACTSPGAMSSSDRDLVVAVVRALSQQAHGSGRRG